MRIPLRFLLPLTVFLTGLLLLAITTYIQKEISYEKMKTRSSEQVRLIGNRLASRISIEVGNDGMDKQKIVSLTAPYLADNLDQIDIYDKQLKPVFTRSIPSFEHHLIETDLAISTKVIKDLFTQIVFDEEADHIIGYFPLDLRVAKGEVISRDTGVMHLVFDLSAEHEETRQSIIKSIIMNMIIITIMVLTFSFLMYFLVFRRLNTLHKATQRLSEGNFDTYVESKGDNELTQVIHTFNTMAKEMHAYKNIMEEKIELALKEHAEQTKILIQQSRLASMGEMIGNIAHQWRQPLNALGLIVQKIQIFSQKGKLSDEKLKESVDNANLLIQKMSATIDDFRDFFKPDKQKEIFDLKTVVHDVMALLEAGFEEKGILVEINIKQPKCEIYGFKNEFSQVIINLLNNSKDAFAQNNITDGKIYISGEEINAKIIFKVSDNAGGIDENIIDRIFEPYYTTKEEGKGTGIGLYMSKMIVEENMHAKMQVKNTGLGSEFSMIFNKSKGQ